MKVIISKKLPKLKNGIYIQPFNYYIFIGIYKNNALHNINSYACIRKVYDKRTLYYYINGEFITDDPMPNSAWKSIAKEIIRSKKLKVFQ